MKDVPDLALLAQIGPLESSALRKALDATFGFRTSHPLPTSFPSPPASWATRYATIAKDDELPWATMDILERAVRDFLDPVLAGAAGTWTPDAWAWQQP